MDPAIQSFIYSLANQDTTSGASDELTALWYAKKGDWERAHSLVQDLPSKEAAWVHGYLHWLEGDLWNADYWYRRAEQVRPKDKEKAWEEMVVKLLDTKQ